MGHRCRGISVFPVRGLCCHGVIEVCVGNCENEGCLSSVGKAAGTKTLAIPVSLSLMFHPWKCFSRLNAILKVHGAHASKREANEYLPG